MKSQEIEKIKEKIQAIQDKVDAMGFKGQNEYDLHLREELALYIQSLPTNQEVVSDLKRYINYEEFVEVFIKWQGKEEERYINFGKYEVRDELLRFVNHLLSSQSEPSKWISETRNIIETRIKELNQADADFCKDRWDMSKSPMERSLYRGFSNEVTFARQELEKLLKQLPAPPTKQEGEKGQ
jgi:hypothetical protein